jgi:hypothetical protein
MSDAFVPIIVASYIADIPPPIWTAEGNWVKYYSYTTWYDYARDELWLCGSSYESNASGVREHIGYSWSVLYNSGDERDNDTTSGMYKLFRLREYLGATDTDYWQWLAAKEAVRNITGITGVGI